MPEGEACNRFRRELAEVARAFADLRASARALDPVPGDLRLALTEWAGDAGLARYGFPKPPATQNLPLFCAAEVDLLDRLRAYLNCPAAKAALPPDPYRNLYDPAGFIPPLPQAFAVYGRTLRTRMADEYKLAGKEFPKPTADKIRTAQQHLTTLLHSLASTGESH